MENENKEQRAIQGEYNLRMGAYLARKDFEQQVEQAGQDESLPKLSDEAANRIVAAMMANYDTLQRAKKRKKLRGKLLRWGTAVAAVLVIAPAVALNVSASRTALVNYVIQNFDEYSVVQYDQDYNAQPPLGWRSEYYPRWLPEGCKVSKVEFNKGGDHVWYQFSGGYDLSISLMYSTSRPAINTEEYEEKEILINNQQAMLYFADSRRRAILYLPLEDCSIQIEGALTEREICKIAESIKFQ